MHIEAYLPTSQILRDQAVRSLQALIADAKERKTEVQAELEIARADCRVAQELYDTHPGDVEAFELGQCQVRIADLVMLVESYDADITEHQNDLKRITEKVE